MRSKSVLPNDPVHHEAWEKAKWHYQKAQSAERIGHSGKGQKSEVGGRRSESTALKRMKKQIREYVWNFYPDPQITQIFAD